MLAAINGGQEIRNFDCFQIGEAELVTRRDAEEAIGMMLRAGFDPQEAFVTTVAAMRRAPP